MELNLPYKSHQSMWEKHATVRQKPRIIFRETDYYYPIQKQPLCIHPLIQKLGDKAVNYILIQSAYKFMFNIAHIETEIINQIANRIANNAFKIKFPDEMRLDAYTIVMDEAYHAYVAFDYIMQMKAITGVAPLYNEDEKGALFHAINAISSTLDPELKETFELIAVCIAENSITHELAALMKMENINEAFEHITSDHLSDEGRHSSYFSSVLKFYWSQLENRIKDKLVLILPQFIKQYITFNEEENFSTKILQSLSLENFLIQKILLDTYISYDEKNLFQTNPVAKNTLNLFRKCHMLDHPQMADAFSIS